MHTRLFLGHSLISIGQKTQKLQKISIFCNISPHFRIKRQQTPDPHSPKQVKNVKYKLCRTPHFQAKPGN